LQASLNHNVSACSRFKWPQYLICPKM
jgi:hypothetical protein